MRSSDIDRIDNVENRNGEQKEGRGREVDRGREIKRRERAYMSGRGALAQSTAERRRDRVDSFDTPPRSDSRLIVYSECCHVVRIAQSSEVIGRELLGEQIGLIVL